jgi:Ca2+-transporting ATPase
MTAVMVGRGEGSRAVRSGGVEAAYRSGVDDVMAAVGVDPRRGLAQSEAEARLARHGRNELRAEEAPSAWKRLLAQFRGPLTLLLIVATAVSLLVWTIEREGALPYEALTILAVLLLNAGLGFVQEGRAEHALSALRRLSAAHAEVLRDGERRRVGAASLVPGDVLLLEEGSTVPADARVFEAVALQTVEAALTGESTPVTKDVAPIPMEVGLGDRTNMVLSGTLVSYGRGRAVVTATGAHTEIGAVAGLLSRTPAEETPLQRELAHVGRLLGRIVVAIALAVAVTIVLVQQVRTLPALVSVLLLAVALAVAAVPEGLTAITTIVLSLGTERMARRRVIIRKLSAVQALGSATVICSDKTGTLTKNEMTVRVAVTAGGRTDFTGTGYEPEGELRRGGRPLEAPAERGDVERLLRAAVLASNATLSERDGRWEVLGDPTEGALVVAARKAGVVAEDLAARFSRVGEIPFSSERKLMSTAQTDTDRGGRTVLVSKGAPDILLARCTHERMGEEDRPLTAERRQAILAAVEGLAAEALRTLGLAFRVLERAEARPGFDLELERELVWLGLVGMIDPPRPETQKAVREAREAGIRTIMITGDHPATAAAIAVELGIVPGGARALAGAELSAMSRDDLERAVKEVSVYARVSPEHKLRIVEALQKQGEVVAMTGDGVNDAPALKRADIGVAMGVAGTDVSKGAADMVLADDNFASIVAAVEEGRGIYGNIQKFLRFLLSSNVGEVMVMFLGVVFAGAIGLRAEVGEPLVLPLLATMILWVNLLTDSGPALALGMDAADPHAMRRPPRDHAGHVARHPRPRRGDGRGHAPGHGRRAARRPRFRLRHHGRGPHRRLHDARARPARERFLRPVGRRERLPQPLRQPLALAGCGHVRAPAARCRLRPGLPEGLRHGPAGRVGLGPVHCRGQLRPVVERDRQARPPTPDGAGPGPAAPSLRLGLSAPA